MDEDADPGGEEAKGSACPNCRDVGQIMPSGKRHESLHSNQDNGDAQDVENDGC